MLYEDFLFPFLCGTCVDRKRLGESRGNRVIGFILRVVLDVDDRPALLAPRLEEVLYIFSEIGG